MKTVSTTSPLPVPAVRVPALMRPAVIVSADWSKVPRKRSVHVADVGARRIIEVPRDDWDLNSLLDEARRHKDRGPVVIAMDLVFGLPAAFWGAVKADPRWRDVPSFIQWLAATSQEKDFFDPVDDPAKWALDRPFFRVQPSEGGRSLFEARVEGGMRRRIDRATQANPMFAASGIPGSVGAATCALWQELAPLLAGDRDFSVWPFEDENRPIRIVESYPGLAYAGAIAESLPTARLRVAKGQTVSRDRFCDQLQVAPWLSAHDVDLGDLSRARANEDVFDSLVTAAAALRCVLEGRPLCASEWIDPVAEGTMLLAGPIDPSRPSRAFDAPRVPGGIERNRKRAPRGAGHEPVLYPCPIPGCTKVFHGSRGGWDSHVESHRQHPEWHPEVTDHAERKARFRAVFASWFE